jgi:enoyl-CoA hydratase/carnithine racemase
MTTLMLNRPDAMNALSSGLMLEIEQASREFLDDEETRVVIFRGAG